MALISDARKRLHAALIKSGTLSVTSKMVNNKPLLVASFSDKSQASSKEIEVPQVLFRLSRWENLRTCQENLTRKRRIESSAW